MNRDELLELCFNRPVEELPSPSKWFARLPDIGDDWTLDPAYQGHVLSLVGLGYRRILLRNSVAPGSGVISSATTITVAAIMCVCTDPDHRGQGYATELMNAVHTEAAAHALTSYAALFAGPENVPFYERFGYAHPERSPEHFLVAPLTQDVESGEPVPWPTGSVDTRGSW